MSFSNACTWNHSPIVHYPMNKLYVTYHHDMAENHLGDGDLVHRKNTYDMLIGTGLWSDEWILKNNNIIGFKHCTIHALISARQPCIFLPLISYSISLWYTCQVILCAIPAGRNKYMYIMPNKCTIRIFNGVTPTQIAKFMGPTWGPHGSCRPHVSPELAPWTLLSGKLIIHNTGSDICLTYQTQNKIFVQLYTTVCPFWLEMCLCGSIKCVYVSWSMLSIMTSSNVNIFRVTGHLCGEFNIFVDLRLNNGLVNIREAGDLRRYRAHYDVSVICITQICTSGLTFKCNRVVWRCLYTKMHNQCNCTKHRKEYHQQSLSLQPIVSLTGTPNHETSTSYANSIYITPHSCLTIWMVY